MSLPSGATKEPASDLTSFDLSKHSPDQIARLFARWKEQRKRLEHAEEAAPIPARNQRLMPALKSSSTEVEAPHSEPTADPDSRSHPLHYSADFAAILDGGDNAAAQRIKSLKFPPSRASIARSRLRWTLAGAASVIAVTAVAGTVYWPEGSNHHQRATVGTAEPAPAGPAIEAAPEMQTALPFLPAVTNRAGAEPLLHQQLADLAHWQSPGEMANVPLLPVLKPDAPVIQTAGKGTAGAGLASATEAALGPTRIAAVSSQGLATLTSDTALEADVEEAAPARTTPVSSGLDLRGRDRPESSDRSGTSVAGLQRDRPAPDPASGSGGGNDPDTGAPADGGTDGGASAGGSTGGSGTGSNGGGGSSGPGGSNGDGAGGGSGDGGSGGGGGSGDSSADGGGPDGGSTNGGDSGDSGSDGGSSGGDSSGGNSGGRDSGGGASDAGGEGGGESGADGGEGGEGSGEGGEGGGDGAEGGDGSGESGEGGGDGNEGGEGGGEGGESGGEGGEGGEGGGDGGEGGEGGGEGGRGGGEGGEGGRGGGDD